MSNRNESGENILTSDPFLVSARRMVADVERAFDQLAEAFATAAPALDELAEAMRRIGSSLEVNVWWPFNDDEWLSFAWYALRRRRYRLAWFCIRRAFRAHCEAIGLWTLEP